MNFWASGVYYGEGPGLGAFKTAKKNSLRSAANGAHKLTRKQRKALSRAKAKPKK